MATIWPLHFSVQQCHNWHNLQNLRRVAERPAAHPPRMQLLDGDVLRQQETILYRKMCAVEVKRDPMTRFYRGYYDLSWQWSIALMRTSSRLESEPALLDTKGIELVVGASRRTGTSTR